MCITIRRWLTEEGTEHLKFLIRLQKVCNITSWLNGGTETLNSLTFEACILAYYREIVGIEVKFEKKEVKVK